MLKQTDPMLSPSTSAITHRSAMDVNYLSDQSSPLANSEPTARTAPLTRHMGVQLAALLLLMYCTIALSPRALAQTCGPDITLAADQWTMVGVPCQPGANNTIGDIFGPSLNSGDYGVTWIAWRRIYDTPTTCTVASGAADCYQKLTLADTVSTGDAFWIYTTVAADLDMSAVGASNTPGPNFQFPAILSPDGASRYYMFANPYEATVQGPSIQFPLLFLGFFPYVASMQQAINSNVLSRNVHYWNGNTYYTEDLTTPAATFIPKDAAWFEMLQPNTTTLQSINIRIPDPGTP